MQIEIKDLNGETCIVSLVDVGVVYEEDDVIYFAGVPYILSSAKAHNGL